jgi:SHAQKYF class myb-like DNA-binding protein
MEHSEAGSKRSRKPYKLTKARESWSNDEHERFIKALQLYNRDWRKIETYVGTKTVVQIRSHAQKYFQKIMKSGITDAIPPPRPKRRPSDPPHGACHHTDAKHMRLASDGPSRQGSGKDEDSDDGMQLHQQSEPGPHAHHQPQHQHSSKQHTGDLPEPSAQLEASRALISTQGLQHVYLVLAALFTQPQADLAAMLPRLSTRDRHVLTVLLKSLVDELSHQQHTHQHTQHSDQHLALHDDELHHQDDQHPHQQHLQHVSGGSGGQSNGATANTTAGTTGSLEAAAAAYAAAQPAAAALTPSPPLPAAGAAAADAGEHDGQQNGHTLLLQGVQDAAACADLTQLLPHEPQQQQVQEQRFTSTSPPVPQVQQSVQQQEQQQQDAQAFANEQQPAEDPMDQDQSVPDCQQQQQLGQQQHGQQQLQQQQPGQQQQQQPTPAAATGSEAGGVATPQDRTADPSQPLPPLPPPPPQQQQQQQQQPKLEPMVDG